MSPMSKLPLTLEHALLGLLRERPMHAYEMFQELAQPAALGMVWRLKQSQLYALLARLEQAGHLHATTEQSGSRPPRRLLQLTPAGRAAFEGWVTAPVAHGRDFRVEFLSKLFFAQRDGPASVAALIEVQRLACRRWLDDLRGRSAALGVAEAYDRLVVQFRIGQIEAILAWLDTCHASLVDPPPARPLPSSPESEMHS